MFPQRHRLQLLAAILTFLVVLASDRAVHTGFAANTPSSAQNPNVETTTVQPKLALASTAIASDIFDAQGRLNVEAYRELAANYSSDAGIAYRYGPDHNSYQLSRKFPTYWKPSDKRFDNHGNGAGWDYQVGGPQDASKNNYSSNMAQVLYVADTSQDRGVDTLTTLLMAENTFSEKPQLPWVYYGGGHPEPNVLRDDWQQANGGEVKRPTALGRSYGYSNWGVESLMAFNSGLLGTTGSNTANNAMYVKLPANKVPTAVAVTNNNEFALVTIWDTQALKGQVAVLTFATGNKEWWGDWKEQYPGLRNRGLWTFMKLLGYVDLPEMVAPTEISVSSDYRASGDDGGWLSSPDDTNARYMESDLTLSDETNRQSFINGPNKNSYSQAGFATIISKSERKAAFLDLKPLFQKVQTMYFSTRELFERTLDVGQAPTQWPYTFDITPDFAPQVVKVINLADKPTAVRTSLSDGVNQAYIASLNGTLTIYTVGGYGDGNSATSNDIQALGSVKVGRNPTCIAYAKNHWESPNTLDNQLFVVSRGERKIDWVKLSETRKSGTVFRTLRDSRMLDPIWAEDNDNNGTESYLLSVSDYSGKQVLNYRYGLVVYHGNGEARYGMGPDAQAQFEFGGAYSVSGKPFRVSGANVP